MPDEQALIERAKQGELDAFRELVEGSRMNVYRLAFDLTGNKHDAEDLSQEVFLKAFRSLASFRGDSKWSTWLYRITVNTNLDHRKKKSEQLMSYRDDITEEEPAAMADAQPANPSPDRIAEGSLIQRRIEHALGRLSPRERAVFVLRHYHDLPLKQIAGSLRISEGAVKSFLFRAIQRLQKELAFYRVDIGMENEQ